MLKKKIIAVIGLHFGQAAIDLWIKDGPGAPFFEIGAVCDINQAKAKASAQQLGCKAYFSLDEVLEDPTIEAVFLFTSPIGRANLIRQIIRTGRDVMTTKPFELDPVEALDVLHEAKRLNRVVHMNSPSPLLGEDLSQVTRWRDRYNLGCPISCQMETWANYREKADGSWYDNPDLCPAAPIFRLGIYMINDLVRLFGAAESVNVLTSRVFTKRPTVDNAHLGILFKSGAIGSISSSFCVHDIEPYRDAFTLNFERGTIYRNAGPYGLHCSGVAPERGKTYLSLVMGTDGDTP
ncbi:TPA: hypothetical protein DDW35_09835, partial [Candidatus Sumerlaeota bacterium]|nr:hypothetical protein [Candidatus Sumerlaeota bacterium]